MCLTSHIDHNRFLKLEYIIDIYQYYSLNVRVNVPLFVVDSRVRTLTKVITPGKIVSYRCCFSSWNIGVKKNFDTNLFN